LDAYTTKESTCFYARVLEEHTELALDVLTDLLTQPLFREEDVTKERSVILEEIKSLEDNPEELVGDLAMTHLWPKQIMGDSILGTEDSLGNLDAAAVRDFHQTRYGRPRVVVGATGAVDDKIMRDWLHANFGLDHEVPPQLRELPHSRSGTMACYTRDISQLHLNLFTDAPALDDPRRPAVQLLAEVLGGGMSSRLFQRIRERSGLAYSVYSYSEHFSDSGMFGVGMAVSPEKGQEALEMVYAELEELQKNGLRNGELDAVKAQARGSLIMGEESLTNRMLRMAHSEYRLKEFESLSDKVDRYLQVTEDDVMEVAKALLPQEKLGLVALGPVTSNDLQFDHWTTVEEAVQP
ncbi:MAG: insulinase family protein, partial [Candidatus Eisenbacteria bacterium]|nr:insulinase family protein [Candidatus Eisenbacteria bacterium]